MTTRVDNAARYLCDLSGWKLSNLQIQKILYLADMNFVGQGRGRLVDEDFEAWDYGPVLPSLYHICKAFGPRPVPNVFWGAVNIENTREGDMLRLAWQSLREQNAGRLVENTHWAGGAWAKRYVPGAKGIKITSSDMIDEYRNRISGAKPDTRGA